MWDLCSLHPSCINSGERSMSAPGSWQNDQSEKVVRLWGTKAAPPLSLPSALAQVAIPFLPHTPKLAPPLQEEPQSKQCLF